MTEEEREVIQKSFAFEIAEALDAQAGKDVFTKEEVKRIIKECIKREE